MARTPIVESSAALRTIARILLLAVPVGLLTTGCTPSSHAMASRGTAVVVFVDFSESVRGEARALFQGDLQSQIIPSLAPGDKILVAPINDRTLTDFRPLVEASFPRKAEFNGWMDNVLKYNREVKDVDAEIVHLKETVRAQVADAFVKHQASPLTDIFGSLLVAQKLFQDEPRRKVLVLMSDMIEDYPPYRFDETSWTPGTMQKILSELEAKGLIPKLSGVCVYVSGVSARSADLVEDIGRFWQAYFRRTGADMDASRYAHVLLHWPPSTSCRSR